MRIIFSKINLISDCANEEIKDAFDHFDEWKIQEQKKSQVAASKKQEEEELKKTKNISQQLKKTRRTFWTFSILSSFMFGLVFFYYSYKKRNKK